jgi:hypothetical protein
MARSWRGDMFSLRNPRKFRSPGRAFTREDTIVLAGRRNHRRSARRLAGVSWNRAVLHSRGISSPHRPLAATCRQEATQVCSRPQ